MVNFLLVPHFIVNVLKRHQLPLSAVYDLKKLRELVSIHDLAVFTALQKHWPTVLGINPKYPDYILNLMITEGASPEDRAFFNETVNTLLVESGQIQTEVKNRLFDTTSLDKTTYPQPYEIKDLGSQCYGVIVYPGYFPNPQLGRALVRDLVSAMYLYCRHDEIAATEFFKVYTTHLFREERV